MNRAYQWTIGLFLSSMLLLTACTPSSESSKGDAQVVEAVRGVMLAQQAAWNRGDIEAFMDGYERAETTTFVSGEELTRGWQTVLDRYKQRYASRDQMGSLDFSDLDIRPLTSSYVQVDGRWRLNRANDSPHGRFTLLFRKTGDAWRIVHDTTTSATP